MRVPNELLRDTITIEDYAGTGAYGPVMGTPRQVRASVQSTGKLMTDANGRVVSVIALVVIRPEAGPVPIESRVTYAGVTHRVVDSYPVPDSRRPSQYELQISEWSV